MKYLSHGPLGKRVQLPSIYLVRICCSCQYGRTSAPTASKMVRFRRGHRAVARFQASMQIVETIARTRRQHFVQGKAIKEIGPGPAPNSNLFTRVPASETS
jgi:hypothetical protein